jgi:tetratricopeptide (TPR) repeat protein
VMAMLDTGAPYTALERRAARRAGVKPEDMTPVGSVGGAGHGRVRSWTATIQSFELGGEKIANNQMSIDDVSRDGQDMLIGLDYFLSHRIYVSWQQGKFYATWNGGPVFARRWEASSGSEAHAAAAATVADDDADALARRGRASAARNDHARALQDLNRAVELAPGNAAHREARAAVHLAMRAWRPALADLDHALGLDAQLDEARMQRLRLRQAAGDAAGAQADLAELDSRLPESSHLRAAMADVHASQQRLPEALQQWARWIATHPNDGGMAQVLHARCRLRTRLGVQLELALDDCQRAVRLAHSDARFHDGLGWTQLRLNDASRAVKAFDKAIELQPSAAASLYCRALALRQQGEADAAARDLAAARQLRAGIDAEVKKAGFPVPDDLPGI